jgi:hypothetical protein
VKYRDDGHGKSDEEQDSGGPDQRTSGDQHGEALPLDCRTRTHLVLDLPMPIVRVPAQTMIALERFDCQAR